MNGKFKVWDSEKKEFIKDDLYDISWFVSADGNLCKMTYPSPHILAADKKYIIIWSTGRTDKNGVELFAGDRISEKIINEHLHPVTKKIETDEVVKTFTIENKFYDSCGCCKNIYGFNFGNIDIYECEKTGSKYEDQP